MKQRAQGLQLAVVLLDRQVIGEAGQPQRPPGSAPNDAQPAATATAPATPPGRVCPFCGSNRLWLIEIVPLIRLLCSAVPTLDSS